MDSNGHRPDDRATSPVPYVFPPWVNQIPRVIPIAVGAFSVVVILAVWFWFSPKHTEVGYAPKQPVAYSHKLHAGDLGIDCRYCHNTVEQGPHANVPPTETCMNCHTVIRYDSELIRPVKESFDTGKPIEWVRVHALADFAFFSHAEHVAKGVGCVECHGRVDQMEVVRVEEPLSMSWCLDCHRDPGPRLRPRDQITNMAWTLPEGEDPIAYGQRLVEAYHVNPPVDCSGCHR